MERSSAAARTRLLQQLSKNRQSSSPRDEEFATAGSFDINNDAVIHSTAQMVDNTTQQAYALRTYGQGSDNGTEGSAEMSIELGRGVKRGARKDKDDASSNAIFNLGEDSLYEVTGTPPIKARPTARKMDGVFRREASNRGANDMNKSNEAVKRTASGTAQRTLAEALGRTPAPDDTALFEVQTSNTVVPRNTRFTRSRHTSAPDASRRASGHDGTSRRAAATNQSVQSATYTANSFMLPDLPNIAELVSGTRKDGSPVFSRTTAKSNSRFTSGTYKPLRPEHAPIERVSIPAEEQALYTSLQLLKEKVARLEMENSAAQKRTEQYENEVIDLRTQLQLAQRRPDSALGSDEEDGALNKLRTEKARLQASQKALQERLNRSEQKQSVSAITVDRVMQEREKLITQIGIAYHQNEEFKAENEAFQECQGNLQQERDCLIEEVERLRNENMDLRAQLGTHHIRFTTNTKEKAAKDRPSKKQDTSDRVIDWTSASNKRPARRSNAAPNDGLNDDIALRIAREVQMHRDRAATSKPTVRQPDRRPSHSRRRSRSKSQPRREFLSLASAHVQAGSDVDSTEFEITEKTRQMLQDMQIPGVSKAAPKDDVAGDVTVLSDLDPNEFAKLRKKIEDEYRAKREKRTSSAPIQLQRDENTRNTIPRKPSLKDIGEDREVAEEESKVPKSVRVQSPHTSDASNIQQSAIERGELSTMSNTSRRRRAVSADGMTSAFIVPDITLYGSHALPTPGSKNCAQHSAGSCTICRSGDQDVSIPRPVPVSERAISEEVDITNATVRPAQSPPLALASVIKQLEDEITHLKLQLEEEESRFHRHVPALSKRKRELINSRILRLQHEANRRMDQVYALYDVLEGQKQAAARGERSIDMPVEELEETLMSIGLDPVELSGRVGRSAPPAGLNDTSSEASDELPWEGLSDYESEEDQRDATDKRKSAVF